MYLIIHEDGSVQSLDELTQDEFDSHEAGICDLIHVKSEDEVLIYQESNENDNWVPVDHCERLEPFED